MKKLLRLTKLLLTAALFGMGQSAWAAVGDVVTNANIDFSNSIVNSTSSPKYSITGTVGSMTWERQWSFTPTIVDGILRFGNFDDYIDANTKDYGGGVVELQNNNIGAKDIVTIKFDLAFGKLSGKHVGFKFVDTEGEDILTQWFDAYNADFDDANPLSLDWNEMYRGSNEVLQERCVNFTITIDYSKNTIKTETTCLLSGSGKPATDGEHTVTLPSTTPIGKFVLMGNINNADRYSTIDNLLIQTKEGDYSTETAGYTINWVCNNQIVKTDNTRSGDVGASITLLPADKTSFTQGDTRYIYVSDDASSKTVAKGDGTVVTVTLREANKYNYSITTSYNSHMLAWSTSGSVWEDQNNVTFQVPRFQVYGETTLVEAPYGSNGTLNKTITVSENNYSYDVEFNNTNITNLFLLSEAENLGTEISTNATSFTDRVSNSAIIYAASGTLLSLDPGKYIFTLGVIGGDNGSHKVNYTVSAGQTQIIDGTCTGNVLKLMASNEFTLFETTAITFTCSDPASSRGVDLVYVQKLGERVGVGANGYATFASPYALDLTDDNRPAGLKAYKATLDGTTLSFEKLNQTVPAGTGLLLLGTPSANYSIPVVAEGESVGTNALVGVTSPTPLQSSGSGSYYFVMKKAGAASDELTFAPLSTTSEVTIPAGKAYVEVPASVFATPSGARSLAISFIDDVTGINMVDAAENHADGIYNLNGQRVVAPSKGLYIMNGKKVIMK